MFVSNITAIGPQVSPINSQPRLVTYVGRVTESDNETPIIRYSTSVPQNYWKSSGTLFQVMSCPETHVLRYETPHVTQACREPCEVFARASLSISHVPAVVIRSRRASPAADFHADLPGRLSFESGDAVHHWDTSHNVSASTV